MKIFIWENVTGLTHSYHDGGGTIVFAESLEKARDLLKAKGVSNTSEAFSTEPDYETLAPHSEERVFIFPDAGCCG